RPHAVRQRLPLLRREPDERGVAAPAGAGDHPSPVPSGGAGYGTVVPAGCRSPGALGEQLRRRDLASQQGEPAALRAAGAAAGDPGDSFRDWVREVLSQPELARSERILDFIDVLEQRTLSAAIPIRQLSTDGLSVVIGAENTHEAMQDCSVVIARYGSDGGPS